ncbi:MAG: phospho-2-dehydro-3-deoxyheptonate aldolase [Candidatus Magasanikbacteria bacterium GW2011_GWA2_40_10]|uniref:Phospho-2-dehydro-3-deoxyheptonate aldolase n=1 Tax=Candidatus Magasanikbacteria bacterium GW2011_GWA2_40_10 TaxID=1619037 RepID=A0A0G0Q3X4_9BACT|nr:MAG: phospho-2-dehydro-3-deoxyheptonate aldolase [Candidatus Magasanikbacteria bacterium GW2011_GWA2_40_10]
MNFNIRKKIPDGDKIIKAYPLSDTAREKILRDRQEINDIISGKDNRLIVIVGPCSAWPSEAVLEYAKKLLALNEKVKDKLKIVMRVYIQKPRTTKGWTGPVNQPDPYLPADIAQGIFYTRKMMVDVVEMGLPIADEALFTHNASAFQELLSWVAIGARSTEDQEHRIFASAVDCAVGMKNPTSGSIEIGVNSIVAAQHQHVVIFDGYEVETMGNPYAHLVLRGGAGTPNYSANHLEEVFTHMQKHGVTNPAVIVDISHDNSLVDGKKDHRRQISVAEEVLENIKNHQETKNLVKGFMLESFLKEGSQKVDVNNPESLDRSGLSITDACLGWEQTEKFLLDLANKITQ